jgi:tagaturonate reductase
MDNDNIRGFMEELVGSNIIPAITGEAISKEDATSFAVQVFDRFRNPYLDHKWLTISLHYSSKMKMRILPLLYQFYERFNAAPGYIALGFAAYLLFMKVEPVDNNEFRGNIKGSAYIVQDDKASYFAEKWKNTTADELVEDVLGDQTLWGSDLTELEGFSPAVKSKLKTLMQHRPGSINQMLTVKTVLQS